MLPRFKEEINEEWIADKIRFSYDGLGRQRILTPLEKKMVVLKTRDWENALGQTRNKFDSLDPSKISGVSVVILIWKHLLQLMTF